MTSASSAPTTPRQRRRNLLAVFLALVMLLPMLATIVVADPAAPAPLPTLPDARFRVTPDVGTTATEFVADAGGAFAPAGSTFVWSWGDGASDVTLDRVASHTYAQPGDYPVLLTVSHPQHGSSTAAAWIRVLRFDPEARTVEEARRIEEERLDAYDAVEVAQRAPLAAASVGTVVALVSGLEPELLPLDTPQGALDLTYFTCTPAYCIETDLAEATDPDGASTSALSAMLQKVLNARYVIVNVADTDGRVSLPALTHALRFAADERAHVVVSLLQPESGYDAEPSAAYDPDASTGRLDPEDPSGNVLVDYWRGLVRNVARYDYGGFNHTYPVPSGFNESAHPHFTHDAGHAGGSHSGGHNDYGGLDVSRGSSYGRGADGASTGECLPLPFPGPRFDEESTAYPRFEVWEPSIKLTHDLDSSDLAHLSAAQAQAVHGVGERFENLLCLALALEGLVHSGTVVVAPAGDSARHLGVRNPATAAWDLQNLAGLAAFPEVVAVGATTSDAKAGSGARIVLPTSAAGPAPSLYGVKPDLLAPGDIPVVIPYGLEGARPAEKHNLADGFHADRTRGSLVEAPAFVAIENEQIRVTGHPSGAGIAWSSRVPMPPLPVITADLFLPVQSGASSTSFILAAQEANGPTVLNGFGLEFRNTGSSQVTITSHVWRNGVEYHPPTCTSNAICDASSRLTVAAGSAISVRIRDTGPSQTAPATRNVFAFDILTASGAPIGTMLREVPVDATRSACACDNLTFYGVNRFTGTATTMRADNVTAAGLSFPARAEYYPGANIDDYFMGSGGAIGVRPTTRVAAAYVAAIAVLESAKLRALGHDGVDLTERVRGSLASLAAPLVDVPPFVQGAGEINVERGGGGFLLGTQRLTLGSPGIDFGVQGADARPSARISVRSDSFSSTNGLDVRISGSGVQWWSVDADRTLRSIPASQAPSLSVATTRPDSTTRDAYLNITALPAAPGVYATHALARIMVSSGGSNSLVADPFYAPVRIPILVTRGVGGSVEVAAAGVPDGAIVWLVPPVDGTARLLWEPLLGGPSVSGVAANGAVDFGVIAPGAYTVLAATSTTLPIATTLTPGRDRESAWPRTLGVVAREAVANATGLNLPGTAALPVPVAYRFLDIQQGADFTVGSTTPYQGLGRSHDEAFAPAASAAVWDARGDMPRSAGRTRAEPFPVGETVIGWDVSLLSRPPPVGIGSRSAEGTRQAYLDHILDADAYPYSAFEAHLDPRPYLDAATPGGLLPGIRFATSFPLPKPLEEIHGMLLIPLELSEATATLRISTPGRELMYAILPEGAIVPSSRHGADGILLGAATPGVTYNHRGTPADDLLDDVLDTHGHGILGGGGHQHAHDLAPVLKLEPRREEGYLVPFAFHDLAGRDARLDVSIVVHPDPSSLAGRAAATTPLDPVPGPRVRLDGATVYAWSAGEARLSDEGLTGMDARDLSRFTFPSADRNPSHAPAIHADSFDARGVLLFESFEAYTRGPAGGATVVTTNGGSASNVTGIARSTRALPAAETLEFAFGRAASPIFDAHLHPRAVLEPYGDVTPHLHPVYPRNVTFAPASTSAWRISGALLQALADGSGDGGFRLAFNAATPSRSATFSVLELFPDRADPTRSPGFTHGHCTVPGLLTVATIVSLYAADDCYAAGGSYEDAHTYADTAARAHDDTAPGESNRPHNVTGDIEEPPTPAEPPCLTGEDSIECTRGAQRYIETEAGRIATYLFETIGILPTTPSEDEDILWAGILPRGGALLLLRHAGPANGAAQVHLTLVDESENTHALATLEGIHVFEPTHPKARASRLDIFDLTGFASANVTIRRVLEPGASWDADASSARVLRKTPPLPEPRGTDAALRDAGGALNPRIQTSPAGDTRNLGPAEATRIGSESASILRAPRGLIIRDDTTILDRTLILGSDAPFGSATIHVTKGATLTIEGTVVQPRSPDHPWGILVEDGATLVIRHSTLLDGGAPATSSATLRIHGEAVLHHARVLGGATGAHVLTGGRLVAEDSTFARLARGIEIHGGDARLANVFVDGNGLGILARDATLEITDGLLTRNRDHALLTQDGLVSVWNTTFAWNAGAGARAALTTLEGYDTGRVLAAASSFHGNARAVHARADLHLHDSRIAQTSGPALVAAPGATLQITHSRVEASLPVHADAASGLILENSTLAVAGTGSAIRCAYRGVPALVWLDSTLGATQSAACPAPQHERGGDPADAAPAWRGIVMPPFVNGDGARVLTLPPNAPVRLFDTAVDPASELTIVNGRVSVPGSDRVLTILASGADGAPSAQARAITVLLDTEAPSADVLLRALRVDDFTRARSIPVDLHVTDAGSGVAATDILLTTTRPDGRTGLVDARVLTNLRGSQAVLGQGAFGGLTAATGEHVIVEAEVRDRAGNVARGFVDSVTLDRTPPRAWLNVANPCGDLLGHDFHWRAHDPRVGSGLPLPNATAYTLYVATVNVTALLEMMGLAEHSLTEVVKQAGHGPEPLVNEVLGRSAGGLDVPNFERRSAFLMRELADRIDRILANATNNLNLIDWVKVDEFTSDQEFLRLSAVDTPEDLADAVTSILEGQSDRIWSAKLAIDAEIRALRDERLKALEDATAKKNIPTTSLPIPTLLSDLLGREVETPDDVDEIIAALLAALETLYPVILAAKVVAEDRVGNEGVAYAPVLSDAFHPTMLLYLLGDTLRERAVALVLKPGIRLNVNDLHGELVVFDPDCGMQSLEILTKHLEDVEFANLATLHPREGRIQLNLGGLEDLYAMTDCGLRDLQFVAADRFGKRTTLDGRLLLDRLEPLTVLNWWQTILLDVETPIIPPPPGLPPGWLGFADLRVSANTTSRNTPGPDNLCLDIMAAIHDVMIEGSLDNETWVRLATTHYGGINDGELAENATVEHEANVKVNAAKFGLTENELSGREVTVRIRASDEAGNEEVDTAASFSFTYDRIPPLCNLATSAIRGGFALPATWDAQDSNQAQPGPVMSADLLVRPIGGAMAWAPFAPLPTPAGTGIIERGERTLPSSLIEPAGPILHAVELVCAAYDAAGNLGMGEPIEIELDLEIPTLTWSLLPLDFVNDVATFAWSITETVTHLSQATITATGEHGAPHHEFDALGATQLNLRHGLHGIPDGTRMIATLAATDSVGNRNESTRSVIFDTGTPAGDLLSLAQHLVNGFLPGPGFTYRPAIVDEVGPGGHKAPLKLTLEVQRVGSPTPTKLHASGDEPFVFSSLVDGAYSATLTVCDTVGNCQPSPLPSTSFSVDTQAPTIHLEDILSPVAATILAAPDKIVKWVNATPHIRIDVTEPVSGSSYSGIPEVGGLVVAAQEVSPATRLPLASGVRVPLVIVSQTGTPGERSYVVSTPDGAPLPPNRLFRIEMIARDEVGNIRHVNETTRFMAYDSLTPSVSLVPDSLGRYLFEPAIRIDGSFADVSGGTINSGVERIVLRIHRDNGAPIHEILYGQGGLATGSVSLSYVIPLADDGVNLRFCAYAVDRAGNAGSCNPATSTLRTLLDRTPPVAVVLPPTDASGAIDPETGLPDIYTTSTSLATTLRVTNAPFLPGRDASPLTKALIEMTPTDRLRPGALREIDLTQTPVAAGATLDIPLAAFPGIDGALYEFRAVATDTVGNRNVIGTADSTQPSRRVGEVLLYSFDGDVRHDSSGAGRDLSTAITKTTGKHGSAISFAGTAFTTRSAVANVLGGGDKLTLMTWVRPDPSPPHPHQGLVGKYTYENDYGLILADFHPYAYLKTAGSSLTHWIASPVPLPTNQWSHVAMVYDGATLTLYVNGEAVAVTDATGAIIDTQPTLNLGRGNLRVPPNGGTHFVRYFRGMLDDVRLSPLALEARDIRNTMDAPYGGSGSQVLVDTTNPVSLPALPSLASATALLGTQAYDPSAGIPSGVKSVALEARVLDTSMYTLGFDASQVPPPSVLSFEQTSTTLFTGTARTATRKAPLALPEARDDFPYPRVVRVNARVADNIEAAIPGVLADPSCPAGDVQTGRLFWEILLNGVVALSGDVAADGTTFAPRIGTTSVNLANPNPTLALRLRAANEWRSCYPLAEVRVDDVAIVDVQTGRILAHEPFNAIGDWTLSGSGLTARMRDGAPDWALAKDPNLAYAASFDTVSTEGWTWTSSNDKDTSTAVSTICCGDGTSRALRISHNPLTATQVRREAIGTGFPAGEVGHAEYSLRYTVTGTMQSRLGVMFDLEGGDALVVLHQSNVLEAFPVTAFGRTLYPVLRIGLSSGDTFGRHSIDLAGALAEHGLEGRRVEGVYLWFEKLGTAGSTLRIDIDEVRLLNAKRTVVDLPFAFPYFGEHHTRIHVDEDGFIAFVPDVDEYGWGKMTENAIIAPAWGMFTRRGSWSSNPHGVSIDNRAPDAVTITWNVGLETAASTRNSFSATLQRDGTILFRYPTSNAPSYLNVFAIGISDGEGTVKNFATGSLSGLTAAYLPGNGTWQTLTTDAYPAPVEISAPFHDSFLQLRTSATDRAGNIRAAGAPEAVYVVDTIPPVVDVVPVIDEVLGGFASNRLTLASTMMDNASGIDPSSAAVAIRQKGSGPWQTLQITPGREIVTDTNYILEHKAVYELRASATDFAGNTRETLSEFLVLIEPQPLIHLSRLFENVTLVDDQVRGVVDGVGAVIGDRFSVAGQVIGIDGVHVTVHLDDALLFEADSNAVDLHQVINTAGLGTTLHELRIRATTEAGSWAEKIFGFRILDPIIRNPDAGQSTDWILFPDGETAEISSDASRTGSDGLRIVGTADAGAPGGSLALDTPVGAGRYWAFIRPGDHAGSFDILTLEGADGALQFGLVLDDALRLHARVQGGLVELSSNSLLQGGWTKIEAVDDGSTVSVYMDHVFMGSVSRSGAGPVIRVSFAAHKPTVGELHIDDVAVTLYDPVARVIVDSPFNNLQREWWNKTGTGSTGLVADPAVGNVALRVSSTPSAPTSMWRAITPTVPDYHATFVVGAMGGGCRGEGSIIRLATSGNSDAVALRCVPGGAIEALGAAGWQPTSGVLSSSHYARINLAVSHSAYTVFVNDQYVGEYSLAAAGAVARVILGGGNSELWFDDLVIQRGRVLFAESFKMPRSGWSFTPGSDTAFSRLTSTSFTGGQAARVFSAGLPNEQAQLSRDMSLPERFRLEARVFIPVGSVYDEFWALALGSSAIATEIGFQLTSDARGNAILYLKESDSDFPGSWAVLPPGWHTLALDVDRSSNTWFPHVNGANVYPSGLHVTQSALTKLVVGDLSTSSFGTGRGDLILDDVQVRSGNRNPSLVWDQTDMTVVPGALTLTGSLSDADFGDTTERLALYVDHAWVADIPKGPVWSFEWDTSQLSGTRTVHVLAWQGDAYVAEKRTFTFTS